MNDTQPNYQEDEISLAELWIKAKSYLAFLWRRKLLIVGVGLIFALGGFIKTWLETPTYTAKLTFALEQGNGDNGISSLASEFGFSIGGGDGAGGDGLGGDNVLSLMKSRRIVQEVLMSPIIREGKSVLLVNHFVQSNPDRLKKWKKQEVFPITSENVDLSKQDSALGEVVKAVTDKDLSVTKQDKKLSFVTVSFSGDDPLFARNFVEMLTDQATEFYVATKTSNAKSNIVKLQRRVDSVSVELQRAMLGYSSSQDQNLFTVQTVAKVPTMQKQLKVTMLTTMYGELVKNLELSKSMAARDEPLITIIDRPHHPLRVRSSKLKTAAIGGVLGVFLTVLFLAGRAFFQDLSSQAKALESKK
jgi:hypothetical protein